MLSGYIKVLSLALDIRLCWDKVLCMDGLGLGWALHTGGNKSGLHTPFVVLLFYRSKH
jgi:hypothetical protein